MVSASPWAPLALSSLGFSMLCTSLDLPCGLSGSIPAVALTLVRRAICQGSQGSQHKLVGRRRDTDFPAEVHDATAQPADLERLSRFQIVQHGGLHGRRQGLYEPNSVLRVVLRQRYPPRLADGHRLLYDLVKQIGRAHV